MPRSVHDNLLVSYEVQCEKRTITLHTEYRVEGKLTEFTDVAFAEVQAYHFMNDAFGNIIFDVTDIPAEQFLREYGSELSELSRVTGLLGNCAENLDSALGHLRAQGVRAFILSSSLGLSGWVLARHMSILEIGQAGGKILPETLTPWKER